MKRRSLVAVAVATLLAGGCSREPANDAERLEHGKQLVRASSQAIAGAPAFSVTVNEVAERQAAPGTTEKTMFTSDIVLRRPNRLHVRTTGQVDREYWYDGRRLTVAMHGHRVFGQAPMPETLDRALDAVVERYALPLPLADLLYSDPAQALLSDATTGGYVGTEDVDGQSAVHLSFSEGPVDWEVWLPESGPRLPLRARVTYNNRPGNPTRTMTFSNWMLTRKDPDDVFTPRVPEDYEGIAILQQAAVARVPAPSESDPKR
jgi:hypothetical protein